MMQRRQQGDGEEEAHDQFYPGDFTGRSASSDVASTNPLHGRPQQGQRELSFDASSLRMTMTPTTEFLAQPVLIDMSKDSTGSSHSAPLGHADSGITAGPHPHHGHDSSRGGTGDEKLIALEYGMPNLLWMSIAAVVGAIAGGFLNHWSVDPILQEWIGEIGVLYINIMECLSLPLIFTSVTICIAHLVVATKTINVVSRMMLMFLIAAFLAASLGMLVSYLMASTFSLQVAPPLPPPSTVLALQCPNGKYLSAGGVMCSGKQMRDAMKFVATNITGIDLVNAGEDTVKTTVTYATQIVKFFSVIFQQNITEAFSNGEFLGVIFFGMFIGAGLVISYDYSADAIGEQTNYVFLVLKQLDVVLELILNWFLRWIPLGTVSAMTYSIMTGTITEATFSKSMYLAITLFITLVLYFLCVVCVVYWLLVRKNPFQFFWYLMPALVFMFASGSYVATIPVLMRSIEGSKQVSRTLSQYTVSLGTGLSLCGTAAYFVVSCVYMAYTSGLEDTLTAGRIILLIILSTLSSFGTPHAPGASITYVATIWTTVFGTTVPPSFPFLVYMEWLTVRMRRVQNITVVAFIARVIAEQLDETAEDEEERANAPVQPGGPVEYIAPL